jgi:hypothetical protein
MLGIASSFQVASEIALERVALVVVQLLAENRPGHADVGGAWASERPRQRAATDRSRVALQVGTETGACEGTVGEAALQSLGLSARFAFRMSIAHSIVLSIREHWL